MDNRPHGASMTVQSSVARHRLEQRSEARRVCLPLREERSEYPLVAGLRGRHPTRTEKALAAHASLCLLITDPERPSVTACPSSRSAALAERLPPTRHL